jgi:hypothetical protein
VVDDVFNLKLILVIGMGIREVAELLGRQLETVSHRLGRDEILRHLNTTVKVSHPKVIDIRINVLYDNTLHFSAFVPDEALPRG